MKKPETNTQVTLTRCLKIDGTVYTAGKFLSQELPDIAYEKGYVIINDTVIPTVIPVVTPASVLVATEEKTEEKKSTTTNESISSSNTKKSNSKTS